jgi:hypothetical protein
VTDPVGPPPGWYADPSGEPQYRWWDGAGWQDATQEPLYAPASNGYAGYVLDPSIDTWTLNAWLLSLTPLTILAAQIVYRVLGGTTVSNPGGSASASALLLVFTYSLMLVPVVFAFFDHRTLRQRGLDRPFHWAWCFFGAIVYVIGRAAVAKQRTSHGLAPLVVFLVSCAVLVVGSAITSAVTVLGDATGY